MNAVRQALVVAGCLHDVIGEAHPQAGCGDFLAARVREHDDGQIRRNLMHRVQHLQPVAPAQLIVGDNDIERRVAQGCLELRGIGDVELIR